MAEFHLTNKAAEDLSAIWNFPQKSLKGLHTLAQRATLGDEFPHKSKL